MTIIEHLNAGWLHAPPYPKVCCHCLLLRDPAGLALVDTGIGMEDCRDPVERVGQDAISLAGFQFNPAHTALAQLQKRGIQPAQVNHLIMTHLDPDHAGGLADFPDATVHLSAEELAASGAGDPRYRPIQWGHGAKWMTYDADDETWFGLPARSIVTGFASRVYLVKLFGHTLGHCGVAIQQQDNWTLHVGDAYYLRAELMDHHHPVEAVAAARAAHNARRLESLEHLRRLHRDEASRIQMLGYHDTQELET